MTVPTRVSVLLPAVLVLALVVVLAVPAHADVVHLVNGNAIEGRASVEGEWVVIDVGQGVLRVPREAVRTIEQRLTAAEELEVRLDAIGPDDADGLVELARWAEVRRLDVEVRRDLLDWALDVDPRHPGALRALEELEAELAAEEQARLERERARLERQAERLERQREQLARDRAELARERERLERARREVEVERAYPRYRYGFVVPVVPGHPHDRHPGDHPGRGRGRRTGHRHPGHPHHVPDRAAPVEPAPPGSEYRSFGSDQPGPSKPGLPGSHGAGPARN